MQESRHRRIFLFLDIDGVLNTSAQWKRMYSLNDDCIAYFADYVHSLPSEGAKTILTSSWKNGFDPAGRHSPQIKELIDKLAAHGLSILGKTENDASEDRAKEINDYIRKHHLEQQTCLVIDDDPVALQHAEVVRHDREYRRCLGKRRYEIDQSDLAFFHGL